VVVVVVVVAVMRSIEQSDSVARLASRLIQSILRSIQSLVNMVYIVSTDAMLAILVVGDRGSRSAWSIIVSTDSMLDLSFYDQLTVCLDFSWPFDMVYSMIN
jgi:hypothetical protein